MSHRNFLAEIEVGTDIISLPHILDSEGEPKAAAEGPIPKGESTRGEANPYAKKRFGSKI